MNLLLSPREVERPTTSKRNNPINNPKNNSKNNPKNARKRKLANDEKNRAVIEAQGLTYDLRSKEDATELC